MDSDHRAIHRHCLTLTRNSADADDLAQDVHLAAIRHRDKKGVEPTLAWKKKKAKLLFLNLLKKKKRADKALGEFRHRMAIKESLRILNRADSVLDPNIKSDANAPDMIYEEAFGHLHKEVQNLPTKYRTVVERLYYDGQTSIEVAEEIGQCAITVRVQKSRAIHLLQNALNVALLDR